mmetsp:Transcript_59316/g.129920  ORF Transcript_59316/g.129920 Transcript_59316/m.129920 type:complete len:495 (+) Transcript_59316:107-1591(+)
MLRDSRRSSPRKDALASGPIGEEYASLLKSREPRLFANVTRNTTFGEVRQKLGEKREQVMRTTVSMPSLPRRNEPAQRRKPPDPLRASYTSRMARWNATTDKFRDAQQKDKARHPQFRQLPLATIARLPPVEAVRYAICFRFDEHALESAASSASRDELLAIAPCRAAYNYLDINGSGLICPGDLQVLLRSLGIELTDLTGESWDSFAKQLHLQSGRVVISTLTGYEPPVPSCDSSCSSETVSPLATPTRKLHTADGRRTVMSPGVPRLRRLQTTNDAPARSPAPSELLDVPEARASAPPGGKRAPDLSCVAGGDRGRRRRVISWRQYENWANTIPSTLPRAPGWAHLSSLQEEAAILEAALEDARTWDGRKTEYRKLLRNRSTRTRTLELLKPKRLDDIDVEKFKNQSLERVKNSAQNIKSTLKESNKYIGELKKLSRTLEKLGPKQEEMEKKKKKADLGKAFRLTLGPGKLGRDVASLLGGHSPPEDLEPSG